MVAGELSNAQYTVKKAILSGMENSVKMMCFVRTLSCLQVYLPCVKAVFQPFRTYMVDSSCRIATQRT